MNERNIDDQNNMTYGNALAAGYVNADRQWQRGYLSRKINVMEQPVVVAGGYRKGDLYVLLPTRQSTQYCIRQYLKKK